MQRILIIGGPGTGKSTLAKAVGSRLGLPVVHLDMHYWSPGWVQPAAEDWRRRVAALAAGEAWVMDGNYSGTFDLRLPRTQAIVWLDLPRWIYFPRTVRRMLVNLGRERGDLGAGCPERIDLEFLLRWVWTYPTRSRPRTVKLLDGLAGAMPIVVLRRPREVGAFVDGLPATLSATH
jgi:adenylate kinase family enzyme